MRSTVIQLKKFREKGDRLDPRFYLGEKTVKTITTGKYDNFVKLGDLLDYFTDGSRLTSCETGIPMLRLSNLDACDIHFGGLKYASVDKATKWTKVKSQDVLFTQAAEPFRAAVMPEGFDDITVSSEITVMRPKPAIVPEYLAAILSTRSMGKILKDLAYRRSATALRRLRLKDISEIPIPLPGRDLQYKIKAAYEDAARLSLESETELSQIIQAVYAEIDRKTQAQSTTRRFKIRKQELGGRWDVAFCANEMLRRQLLESGSVTPLLQVAKPVPSTLKGIGEDEEVCAVKAEHINENTMMVESFDLCRLSDLSPRMRQPLSPGDVLICTTGSGEQVAYLDEKTGTEGCRILGSATFTALRFTETPRYFTIAMTHPIVRAQLNSLATGAVQRFISKKDLDALLVPNLSVIWREDFDSRVYRAFERRREALTAKAHVLELAEKFLSEEMKQ
ncbi:MAG: hypothetical protein APF84_12825 [Gracilibacter sp. BRH_c7a]|nr:MAG: hypothetical protein APF84_12825 [Gracilibacter sp. BRH_c7a]